MPIKAELKSWLESVAPLLDKDVRKGLEAELEKDEVANKFKETVLARSDYSRAMDELRLKEQTTAEEQRKAQAWYDTLSAWQKEKEPLVQQTLREKELARAELEAYKAQLKSLSEAGLIDPSEASVKFESPNTPKPNGGAEPKYLTAENLKQERLQMERDFAYALANFGDIADQHQELFGSRLTRKELLDELMQKGGTLEEAWDRKYNVTAKRQELEQNRVNKLIEDARAEERAKVLSERAVDPGYRSPAPYEDPADKHILSLFNQTQGTSSVSEAVKAATAAYQRGDFRTPTQQPPK